MIIYRDVISDDELFTDTFKVMCHNEVFFEVEGKRVTRTDGFDDSLISANASAEDVTECSDSDTSVSGVDIVLNHKLQETFFDKKTYQNYIKGYVKAVKAKLEADNPARVEPFVAAIKKEIKLILDNFSNYQFFIGESMNPDGMVALLNYRADGVTPYMLFFKDGVLEEKY